MRLLPLLLVPALSTSLAAGCGGSVAVDGASGGSSGDGGGTGATGGGTGGAVTTSTSSSTSTTGTVTQQPSCDAPGPTCVFECGSDAIQQPICDASGAWKCPPGTVDFSTCPPPFCGTPPMACEICGPSGWECIPTVQCAAGCPGLVCSACGPGKLPALLGACGCACNDQAQFVCELLPGCCNEDLDCGDFAYVPCAQNVCKQQVPGGCWKDEECPAGQTCEGESICPCGYDCGGIDAPGKCVP